MVPATLLLAFVLLPGGALGRAAVPEESAALDPAGVRLEGQVHDAQGAPAPEARVLASGRRAQREASSAADGSFVIESLPPGIYTVQAKGSGASSQPIRVTLDAGTEPRPVVLVLEAAQQVKEIPIPNRGHGSTRGALAAFLLAGACVATRAAAPRVAHSNAHFREPPWNRTVRSRPDRCTPVTSRPSTT